MTKNGEPLGRDSNFLRKVLKVKGCGVGAVPFTSLGIALDLLMHEDQILHRSHKPRPDSRGL